MLIIVRSNMETWVKMMRFRHLLISLAVMGFLWQTFVVSIQYFKYETATSVAFVMPERVSTQNTVLCARYRDVMNKTNILEETGIDFLKDPRNLNSDAKEELLTVRQIFKYTPDTATVISSCLVRDAKGTIIDKPKCNSHFNVSKFYTQEFICYKFQRLQADNFLLVEVTQSMFKAFFVNEIILSSDFSKCVVIEAIVYDSNSDLPFKSRNYAARIWSSIEPGMASSRQNYLYLYGFMVRSDMLERPYDTGCENRGDFHTDCLVPCRINGYAEYGKVPGSEIITQPYDLKPLSEKERRDPGTWSEFEKVDAECRRKCHHKPCRVTFTVTAFVPMPVPDVSIAFSVNTGRQPDLYSRSLPVMRFIEFFSFVMGCFGIWFGVSFLSLDSNHLKKWRKRNNRRRVEPFLQPVRQS